MAEKGVQVNATVPKQWNDILEQHQWTAKTRKTGLVKQAVYEYLVNHNLLPAGAESGVPTDDFADMSDETP